MNIVPVKIGDELTLRSLERGELPMLRELMNEPATEHMLVGWSFPLNPESHERWFDAQLQNAGTQRLSIWSGSRWVGFTGLWNIDHKDRHAEVGVAIRSDEQGKGYGRAVIRGLVDYAFDVVNLQRLDAFILEYNEASRRTFESCGFSHEGTMRQKIFKNGRYHDLEIYGLLKADLDG